MTPPATQKRMATVAGLAALVTTAVASQCLNGPCYPGNEYCAAPFQNAPMYHLMDQHGCAENDPNGPVFDPVHGVIHHFYQIHLAAEPGHGPDYGHFASKDFVHWAALPVAIWNGLDSSVTPPKVTKYDNEAIFTGSATVIPGAAPDGKSPGIVNVYPGLCNKNDWPACGTGTLLAIAVAADYAGDELLINWTKPSFNPIVQNTQRDPSSAWKTPSGEWRFRTFDSMIYGAASDEDFLAGKFYTIGKNPDFRQCECPSVYPLPAASAGFEEAYTHAQATGELPTTVHKTSCGGDWWQLGTYVAGAPKQLGSFNATPGWEDMFVQRKIDQGGFYASKDNEYPTKAGGSRRINWGWAQVPPASAQTLPREITFNAAARVLQQYPIEELEALRATPFYSSNNVVVKPSAPVKMAAPSGVAKQSEVLVTVQLPDTAANVEVTFNGGGSSNGTPVSTWQPGTDLPGHDYNITHYPASPNSARQCQAACDKDDKCKAWVYVVRGTPAGSGDCCLKDAIPCPRKLNTCTSGSKTNTTVQCNGGSGTTVCSINYVPPPSADTPTYNVSVACGELKDTVTMVTGEKTFEIRLFADNTFIEAYFQQGRVAMVVPAGLPDATEVTVSASATVNLASAVGYPMNSIWVSPDDVRKAPRVYG
eukprot:m.504556 g.504556  ORF g.504556 m.504556 type:complete len:649 (+) comp21862_c0_seq7:117-2063(+)